MTDVLAQGIAGRALLKGIKDLPTLPSSIVAINKMLSNPNSSASQVGKLISHDPALTAKILRIVNSAFYGFASRINTITHSIVILGNRAIRKILLTNYVFESFRGRPGQTAYRRSDFWRHAVGCAAACKIIDRRTGMKRSEEAFITGILHDIGKIVLDQFRHTEFLAILELIEDKQISMRDAELELLGVDHSFLGGLLLEQWGLSPSIINSIGFHHSPMDAGTHAKQAAVVHLADILTRVMQYGYGGDWLIPQIDRNAWDLLGLKTSDLDSLMQDTWTEIQGAAVFLELARK